ncbi:MAG: metallophosphoesterase family protein [candidate division Zixibacteria bacterium]|nr:metallophosphoesterase family protein [candidate division Zixibacteria bacterium]
MKFALISDIHGNLEALTAVLKDIEKNKVDTIHCLGDVIGYGCDPVACLNIVNKNCEIKLMGNHEHLLLGLYSMDKCNSAAKTSHEWTSKQLSDHELALIEKFQIKSIYEGCLLVHASPLKPEEWRYIVNSQQAELAFDSMDENFCFFGHSHLPMIFVENKDKPPRQVVGHDIIMDPDYRYLVNVGSVGQPRDNDPRASYVIVDTDEWEVLFKRVEYDIATAQSKMKKATMPELLVERLLVGK